MSVITSSLWSLSKLICLAIGRSQKNCFQTPSCSPFHTDASVHGSRPPQSKQSEREQENTPEPQPVSRKPQVWNFITYAAFYSLEVSLHSRGAYCSGHAWQEVGVNEDLVRGYLSYKHRISEKTPGCIEEALLYVSPGKGGNKRRGIP